MLEAFAKHDLQPKINKVGFIFNSENTIKFHELICQYVPPCMEYKLHPSCRGKYNYVINDNSDITYKVVPSKILDIYEKPDTKTKKKFDLTIQDNATYLIDNAIVHNSPETTPGGQALKFYSDQRICIRPKGKIKVKEGNMEVIVGQTSSVTFVKNKTARPFGRAEFSIVFDKTSLNPVVMLCNALRADKLVRVYKGLFNIPKEVLGNKDKIETGAISMVDLANYLVTEKLVLPLLDKLIESVEDDPVASPIDDAILEMKENPSLIIAPSNASVQSQKLSDADEKELEEDVADQDVEPEIEGDTK